MARKSAAHPSLEATVRAIQAKVRRFHERGLGEQNTKTSLIEPVLAALGWNVQDPDEVDQEFKSKRRDNPVDYALLLKRKPQLLVEAKGLGGQLHDRRGISQVLGYAATVGVEWCLLTDGNQYCFFKATAAVDAEAKLFSKIALLNDSVERCVDVLSLIARDELEGNKLERYWTTHYVGRQVHGGLEELVREPDAALIHLIKKRTKGISAKDIGQALGRIEVKIEVGSLKASLRMRKQALRSVRQASDLRQIVSAARVQLPLQIHCKYGGKELVASIQDPGVIRLGEKSFGSPSSAAMEAIQLLGGRRTAVNGWDFWKLQASDGKRVPISTLRIPQG